MAFRKKKSQGGTTPKEAAPKEYAAHTRALGRNPGIPTSSRTGAARKGGAIPEPKRGSKQEVLIRQLTRPTGARIADLVQELRWLPHTVRASLTGLRRKGYAVTRSKDGSGETVYRATAPKSAKTKERASTKKPT
jgi:hypothetical protein